MRSAALLLLAAMAGAQTPTIDQTLAILQDYNRHDRIYAPVVARSKLSSRDGDRFRFFLRFAMKKVITVVVNSEHEAHFARGPDRAEGWIHSTRIAEVENLPVVVAVRNGGACGSRRAGLLGAVKGDRAVFVSRPWSRRDVVEIKHSRNRGP